MDEEIEPPESLELAPEHETEPPQQVEEEKKVLVHPGPIQERVYFKSPNEGVEIELISSLYDVVTLVNVGMQMRANILNDQLNKIRGKPLGVD